VLYLFPFTDLQLASKTGLEPGLPNDIQLYGNSMFLRLGFGEPEGSTERRLGFRDKWWNKYITILKQRKKKIINLPRNTARIFVRQLETLESSAYANNRLFIIFPSSHPHQ
jgi:hypothetical protein